MKSAIVLLSGGLDSATTIYYAQNKGYQVYALIFESGNPADKTLEEKVVQTAQKLLNKKPQVNALPPQQSIPTSGYIPPNQGNWRDTNDLTPNSIIDGTTKLLEKDK